MTTTSLIDCALDFAGNGWRVHPVWGIKEPGVCACPKGKDCPPQSQGKHPILPLWQKIASAEEAAVRKWWKQNPDANLGIATGRESGFFVFDVDGIKGRTSLAALEEKNGPLAPTLMARSGRPDGGVHYYFKIPESEVRNKQGFLPGIDIRGECGFAIGPPSVHKSGNRYSWINEGTPMAEAPLWLIDALKPKEYAPSPPRPMVHTDQTKKAAAYLAKMPGSISGSGGHDAAFKAAVVLVKGFSLPKEDALSLLMSDFNHRCQPPWSEKELRHKVSDADNGKLPDGFIANRTNNLRVVKPSWDELNPPPISDEDAPPPIGDEDAPAIPPTDIVAELEKILDDKPSNALREPFVSRLLAAYNETLLRVDIESLPKFKRIRSGLETIRSEKRRSDSASDDWREKLDYTTDKKGNRTGIRSTVSNAISLLTNHPSWAGVLAWDNFPDRIAVKPGCPIERYTPEWSDDDDTNVQAWLEVNCQFYTSQKIIVSAIKAVSGSNRFDSAIDYARSLTWDGKPRIDSFVIRLFGAEDNSYHREASAKWFVGMAGRILEPGCKMDYMLVLDGCQGVGKSTTFESLVPDIGWYRSKLSDLGSVNCEIEMQGRLLCVMDELGDLKKNEIEKVKNFITDRHHDYVPKFSNNSKKISRRSVLAGTVNGEASEYLKDPTGNRRFWIINCPNKATEKISPQERDQMYAEAVARWDAGEKPVLSEENEKAAEMVAQSKTAQDEWSSDIAKWLSTRFENFTVRDILVECLKVELKDIDRPKATRVGIILGKHRDRFVRVDHHNNKHYRRKTE